MGLSSEKNFIHRVITPSLDSTADPQVLWGGKTSLNSFYGYIFVSEKIEELYFSTVGILPFYNRIILLQKVPLCGYEVIGTGTYIFWMKFLKK